MKKLQTNFSTFFRNKMHKNYTIEFRNYNRKWMVFFRYVRIYYLDQLHAFEQYHMIIMLKYFLEFCCRKENFKIF